MTEAYFQRLAPQSFQPTAHTSGAWRPDEQHIGPALGLLVHACELDRDERRDDHLVVGRLSYDILGTIPVGEVTIETRVLRPGRTIELVEAVLSHAGRATVVLRCWLMQTRATAAVAGSALQPMPPRDRMDPWRPSDLWEGGFLASTECVRELTEPGRAAYWMRPKVPLLADEPVSAVARLAGLMDIANGCAVREDPQEVAFPNVDLTTHLFAEPEGEWLGFDTSVSFGNEGLGLTHTVLHDERGPIGAMSQLLTVRPREDAR